MISVLVPVRNAAATLPAALEGLLAQTYPDVEILVLDDGSDDAGKTRAVMEAAARRDARVHPVHLPHGGIARTLVTGLSLARGRYIARMDADDTCHETRLELQAAFLDAHPDIGLAGCLARFGGDPARAAGYNHHLEWTNSLVTPDQIALGRFRESPLPHPTVMFRAEVARRHGGYVHGPFPEDYELWLRWLDAGVRMAKVPKYLVTWNDPPDRLSRTDPRYAPHRFHRLKAPYLARHLARTNPFHPAIQVMGAGRITRKRAEMLCEYGVAIDAWWDIDPDKVGRTVGGRPVRHRDELPPAGSCFLVSYVASRGAAEDIATFVANRGYVLGRDFLPAA
ncbi:glycosyltransferase [Desulfolutivibrio sulfoxidireducens]|uniref:glycosyltransferase n=1 Tax=Desulfolutivibrio sulfoxidireducens TaxID=2773299 RepID=UPI00159D2E06|nr:glycosyltransferase [Desulfolutivibrio sulfoxidireducens]QLA16991.1 glycosyltransferase [Desulfolutivibrio sulfoxidireducens]